MTAEFEPSRDLSIETERDPAPGASPELVQAFRMNAEALNCLQAMQQELVDAVQRSNRSEMMLQNTQALNQTFRNLTQVQRTLMDRLEASAAPRRNRMVPLMLLGLLVVLVGGVAALVEAIRQGGGTTAVDQAQLAEQVRATYARGREEGAAHRVADIARMEEAITAAQRRVAQHQEALDASLRERQELERGQQALEYTNQELAQQVAVGRQASFAQRALEAEIEKLRREHAAADSVVKAHEEEARELRAMNQKLRKRIVDAELDLPGGADYDPDYDPDHDPHVEPTREPAMRPVRPPNTPVVRFPGRDRAPAKGGAKGGSGDLPSAPAAVAAPWGEPGAVPPPPVVRKSPSGSASGVTLEKFSLRDAARATDLPPGLPPLPGARPAATRPTPMDVRNVRTSINDLLDRSTAGSGTRYKVTSISDVTADGVRNLRLIRQHGAQGIPEIITAKRAQLVYETARDEVALLIWNGERVGQTRREPIPPQGARITVARAADAKAWLQSDLRIIQRR